MSEYGLLIHHEYCTGCHSCEVACKNVLDLKEGEFGIRVLQDGPRKNPDGSWEYNYIPLPTTLCDLCAARVEEGRLPSCVHHCQGGIMFFDTLENLQALQATKARSSLFFQG